MVDLRTPASGEATQEYMAIDEMDAAQLIMPKYNFFICVP
jgi:hypothetical protein